MLELQQHKRKGNSIRDKDRGSLQSNTTELYNLEEVPTQKDDMNEIMNT